VSVITEDALLAELLRLRDEARGGDPGMTAHEVAESLGTTNIKRARDLIARMIGDGRMVAGKRPIVGIDGRRTFTNVYRLKEAAP
jgi:hypothetical protein